MRVLSRLVFVFYRWNGKSLLDRRHLHTFAVISPQHSAFFTSGEGCSVVVVVFDMVKLLWIESNLRMLTQC